MFFKVYFVAFERTISELNQQKNQRQHLKKQSIEHAKIRIHQTSTSGKNKRTPKQSEPRLATWSRIHLVIVPGRSGTDLRRNEDHHKPTKRQKTNRNGTVECWTPPSLRHRDGPWTTRDNERVSMKLITALLRSQARGVSFSMPVHTCTLLSKGVFWSVFNCRLVYFRVKA